MAIEERFAYETFRPGQRELAERVRRACLDGEVLIAEAMSGFGKTAAVLAGGLSAAEETGSRIVYTCRTKRQINRVVEEVSKLQQKHPFKAAPMLSKFDYCLLRRQRAVPQESFGWYYTFNVSNNLCSYFLNVPLAEEFDRNSVERRNTILIADEAHNLRDFFRTLNSATLTLDQVRGAVREAEAMLMDEAASSLAALSSTLEELVANHGGWLLDRASVLDRFRDDHGTVWL
ncbi:MAG TPA: DEAD/DEAH box helicase [Nitrososphaerales archaeon]|nr:DEAD/DEAH box helicase [Nitrososphaerales archaeon]